MNFINSLGGIAVIVRLFSGKEWLFIAIWCALIFALSFLVLNEALSLRLIFSGMLTWCLVLTSLLGVLSNRVAFNNVKFEMADTELVRVSHLVDELQEKISDLEDQLQNKTLKNI